MTSNANPTDSKTTTNRYSRFTKTPARRSTYTCIDCGKRTRDTGRGEEGTDLCWKCYEAAGWENAHSDNDHAHNPDPDCPICAEIAADRAAAAAKDLAENGAQYAADALVEQEEEAR